MKYEEPTEITKEAVRAALSGPTELAAEALIRAALTIKDCEWVESVLIEALSDPRVDVQKAALISFGHLARIHKRRNLSKTIPLLRKYANDPVLGGVAEDAIEDINIFIDPETPHPV
jgi:hypothetical protein